MFMTTIVAIALGFAPIKQDGSVEPSRDNYIGAVGRYSQIVDRAGTNHVRGFNRLTGAPYELTVDRNGHVQGTVGDWDIAFSVKEAA
jgi:hypothetical protein